MTHDQDLWLDPAIRNWVLLPITLTMILVGVLRSNVMALLHESPKSQPLKQVREQRILTRGAMLRTNANHLPKSDFEARKAILAAAYASGDYLSKPAPPPGTSAEASNPLSDPSQMEGMMDGLKKQMVMFVPQTIIMGWINYFFSGFVLIRLPFPLTVRFKSMMQRGIDTTDMDVTWVSSLSWYFLNLFGLGSVYRLLLGDDNAADGTKDMQAMQNLTGALPGAGMGPAPDFTKLYASESESLDLVDHAWICDEIEGRVLRAHGYDVM